MSKAPPCQKNDKKINAAFPSVFVVAFLGVSQHKQSSKTPTPQSISPNIWHCRLFGL
jgi:hypothetical protein